MRRSSILTLIIFLAGITAACGGGGGSQTTPPVNQSVLVSPGGSSIRAGTTQPFTATVTGVSNPAVTWTVNGIASGNATVGTIASTGALTSTYTAPATPPASSLVTVAASVATDASVNGSTVVSLLNPIPQASSVSPSPLFVGAFTIRIFGSGFVNGAVAKLGSSPLSTQFISGTELLATGTTVGSQAGTTMSITVTNPDPGSASSGAVTAQVVAVVVAPEVADRFLEQSTFGATQLLVAQVQQSGLPAFLTSQFAQPASVYAAPAQTETNLGPLQQRFFMQALYAPDQLRQRVAFALGEIFVISGTKITTPQAFTPYLQLLSNDAFTNYRQIMQDVSLSPAMGHYLDMVNNDKPNTTTGTHADENYARELMQLFTIGESLLNDDGSLQHDSSGNPVPTYTQDIVGAFANAYTGWTYPTQPGATLQKHNPAYWTGPMVAFESNHDTDSKQLLQYPGAASGGLVPGGQSTAQDLKSALDNIFNHPNVPPFVSKQLIEHLVTSNPSPAYVQRVAEVFENNGAGVRGDMQAVVTAILLDPEGRQGDNPANATASSGHLKEPILYMAGLLRAFGAVSDGSNLAGQGGAMGQTALLPASVFNFFSPSYVITGSSLVGPEFQILTTATSLSRVNWVNSFMFGSLGTGTTVDLTAYATEAASPSALLASLNTLMLHGTMSANMQSSILTAIQAVPAGSTQGLTQAKTAIYLIGTSSQYQVQH